MTPAQEFELLLGATDIAERVLTLSHEDNITDEQRAAMEDAGETLKAAYTLSKRAVAALKGSGSNKQVGVLVGERYQREGRTCLVLGIIDRTVIYRFKGEPMRLDYYTAFLNRHTLSQGI